MKTLREWQLQLEHHEDSNALIESLKELGNKLTSILKEGSHESPKYLELIGHINEINKIIADVEHGNIPTRQKWLSKFYEWQGSRLDQSNVEGEAEWLASLGLVGNNMVEELKKYQGDQFPGYEELNGAVQDLMKVVELGAE
jgi:hypothetical protein